MHAKQQTLQYLTFKLLFGGSIDGRGQVAEMKEEEKRRNREIKLPKLQRSNANELKFLASEEQENVKKRIA